MTRKAHEMANEQEASAHRLIVLSDGVVAIAITLLILPLTEIEPAEGSNLADVVVQTRARCLRSRSRSL